MKFCHCKKSWWCLSSPNVTEVHFIELLRDKVPLIDVRAPVEFQQGHLPGAVNLPILNDEERALIGTIYKQQGSAAAVAKGFELISGDIKKSRVSQWQSFVEAHPSAVLYCFRGGKRSQITQQWLRDIGIDRPLIVGGYKRARQFLMEQIEQFSAAREMLVLSGPTGSGKTELIKKVHTFFPTVDLEGLARHRGSAFGATEFPQPTQINFENQLATELLQLSSQFPLSSGVLVEDESRLIGRLSIPESFFLKLRSSKVLWLDEPLENRVTNIFKDYIMNSPIGRAVDGGLRCKEESDILREEALRVFAKFKHSLNSIRKKLGGLRAQEVLADIEQAEMAFLNHLQTESNKVWIEKLLRYYYDPMYLSSLERRQVTVQFKGSGDSTFEYLKSL